ncbi:MAG: murein biosynthesis integral membrane protein MurJ, partial [Gemmatimonadota bacterium]|nr:murein biosynthesis integral membrane protein MurJ [Gemmatimonadota bacterium]
MAASRVAAGILVSRLLGLVRERVFAHFFGNGALASAWRAALKIPNIIQNLLGEGSLSASFIPVYVRLLEEGREEEAGRVAGAVLGLLAAVAGTLALLGTLAAPWIAGVVLWGWEGGDPARATTVSLLRILFPMTGVLVLSAWLLGILNSHRRFFVSYVAPAVWNAAMITVLVAWGWWRGLGQEDLLLALGWGALAGGLLQILVQLPFALPYLGGLKISLDRTLADVREVVRNFLPVAAARGAVNLSGLFDLFLASFLLDNAIATMGYAQTLYVLPVSLFGMSIAAAELPELSRDEAEGLEAVRNRAENAIVGVTFWMLPSALGYVLFGEEVVAAIFRTGAFGANDAVVGGWVLAAYALGLPASGVSRVLSSSFYALRDTRTPASIAYARILVSAGVGAALMFPFDRILIGNLGFGAAGLALGASVGAWLEWALLRRSLRRRLQGLGPFRPRVAPMILAVAVAAGIGLGLQRLLPATYPLLRAVLVVGPFGVAYLALTHLMGVSRFRLPRNGGPGQDVL